MLCYKDKTFCQFYILCQNQCDRALTIDIKKEAAEFGLPICQFADIPDCFKALWDLPKPKESK